MYQVSSRCATSNAPVGRVLIVSSRQMRTSPGGPRHDGVPLRRRRQQRDVHRRLRVLQQLRVAVQHQHEDGEGAMCTAGYAYLNSSVSQYNTNMRMVKVRACMRACMCVSLCVCVCKRDTYKQGYTSPEDTRGFACVCVSVCVFGAGGPFLESYPENT